MALLWGSRSAILKRDMDQSRGHCGHGSARWCVLPFPLMKADRDGAPGLGHTSRDAQSPCPCETHTPAETQQKEADVKWKGSYDVRDGAERNRVELTACCCHTRPHMEWPQTTTFSDTLQLGLQTPASRLKSRCGQAAVLSGGLRGNLFFASPGFGVSPPFCGALLPSRSAASGWVRLLSLQSPVTSL